MVLILNLIPVFICIGWLLWAVPKWNKDKQPKTAIIFVVGLTLSLLFYKTIQPSYLPKGEVKRSPVPTFQQLEPGQREVKDLQPKPMSGEARDKRREEQIKEPLPWK